MYMRLFRSKNLIAYNIYNLLRFFSTADVNLCVCTCIMSVYGTETCSTWVQYDMKDTPPYQCRKLRSCRIKSGTVHQRCSASREVWLADGWGSGYVGQYAANRHWPLIWKTVRVREINRMYKTSSHTTGKIASFNIKEVRNCCASNTGFPLLINLFKVKPSFLQVQSLIFL